MGEFSTMRSTSGGAAITEAITAARGNPAYWSFLLAEAQRAGDRDGADEAIRELARLGWDVRVASSGPQG